METLKNYVSWNDNNYCKQISGICYLTEVSSSNLPCTIQYLYFSTIIIKSNIELFKQYTSKSSSDGKLIIISHPHLQNCKRSLYFWSNEISF